MWESHPENNGYGNADREAEARTVRESRYYWMRVNGCGPMPKIRIEGEANMAFYMDRKAPYVFNDMGRRWTRRSSIGITCSPVRGVQRTARSCRRRRLFPPREMRSRPLLCLG